MVAEGVIVPDFNTRDASLPLQVLSLESKARKRKNPVSRAERGVAIDDDMRMKMVACAQFHVFTDDAVRTNETSFANPGSGMNNSGRMDAQHFRFQIADRRLFTDSRCVQGCADHCEDFV